MLNMRIEQQIWSVFGLTEGAIVHTLTIAHNICVMEVILLIDGRGDKMESISGGTVARRSTVLDLPDGSVLGTALWLTTTTVIALIAYYFVGYDQGAVSIFGSDTHIHEFFHDSRHLLGFPCH